MSFNYFVWFFVQPSHLLTLCALAGIGLALTRWRRLGYGLLVTTAVALLLVAYAPIDRWLIGSLENRFAVPALGSVDGIVVLAGAESPKTSAFYGMPLLNGHADRIKTFMRLAHEHPHARLVHSGGGRMLQLSGGREATQQSVAIELLQAAVGARVIYEPDSADTCETPRRVFDVLQPAPDEHWVVVTSAFHMPRTMACFEAVGWRVTPYPTDFKHIPEGFRRSALGGNLERIDLAVHEWAGLVYYRLTGRTNSVLPRSPRAASVAAGNAPAPAMPDPERGDPSLATGSVR